MITIQIPLLPVTGIVGDTDIDPALTTFGCQSGIFGISDSFLMEDVPISTVQSTSAQPAVLDVRKVLFSRLDSTASSSSSQLVARFLVSKKSTIDCLSPSLASCTVVDTDMCFLTEGFSMVAVLHNLHSLLVRVRLQFQFNVWLLFPAPHLLLDVTDPYFVESFHSDRATSLLQAMTSACHSQSGPSMGPLTCTRKKTRKEWCSSKGSTLF